MSVSKHAFLAIKLNKIKYGAVLIYDQYLNHPKAYLFKLLLNENPWDRLPYLLLLYSSHIQYKEIITKAIKKTNLYYVLSESDTKLIKDILINKKNNIPQSLAKAIMFDMKFNTKSNP